MSPYLLKLRLRRFDHTTDLRNAIRADQKLDSLAVRNARLPF